MPLSETQSASCKLGQQRATVVLETYPGGTEGRRGDRLPELASRLHLSRESSLSVIADMLRVGFVAFANDRIAFAGECFTLMNEMLNWGT